MGALLANSLISFISLYEGLKLCPHWEIQCASSTAIKLIFINLDDSIEEFDSFDLNREKVLFPNRKSSIYIGPLPKGKYNFFGEYHPNSARGSVLVIEEGTSHAN